MTGGDDTPPGTGDLFAGLEDVDTADVDESDQVTDSPPDLPLPSGREMAKDAAKKAIGHLTYRELHAFGIGLLPLYTGMVLGSWQLISLSVALAMVAAGLPIRLNRTIDYIHKEPPYFYLGQAVAAVAGGLTIGLVEAAQIIATELMTVGIPA